MVSFLKFSVLYCNDNEVVDLVEMDVEDVLVMVKIRVKKNVCDIGKLISRLIIEIGYGEGCCIWEVEFIWWLILYFQILGYGKLIV